MNNTLLTPMIGQVNYLIGKKAIKESVNDAKTRFNNALESVNTVQEKCEVCENWIDFLKSFPNKG